MRCLFLMSLLIKPIAAIFVANGQGDTAVSNPNRNAVSVGVVLLSNKVCSQSIYDYFKAVRILLFISLLNASGFLRALAKAYSVRFS